MNFRDYKWFNNPRGLRNNGPYTPLDADRYTNPRMGWAKLVVGGTEQVSEVGRLLGHGCMPIIQIYRERMGAVPADDAWFDVYEKYIKAGALWFEFYDEPNAPHFWPLGRDGQPSPSPDWIDADHCIEPVMDPWLDWAERIAAIGGYPAFPAMAETTVPEQSTVAWYEACLGHLSKRRVERFGKLVTSGMWAAVHPYVLNHFYQEPPGGPPSAARPFYQQSHKESGWHFEYPYDPLQQHDDPGRTPFGGTAKTPFGDPNGLVCSGEIFTELIMKMFGTGPVPVIGTAGGISPIPGPDADPVQPDTRYQGYSRESHAEATAAMFEWIAESGPPWLLGLTLSSEASYYPGGQPVPAINLLASLAPVTKEGPDMEIRSGKVAEAMVRAATESSPLDPFSPDEAAEPPASVKDDLAIPGDIDDLLRMPEPMPISQDAPEDTSAPDDFDIMSLPSAGNASAERPATAGPYGDPYAALRPAPPTPEPEPDLSLDELDLDTFAPEAAEETPEPEPEIMAAEVEEEAPMLEIVAAEAHEEVPEPEDDDAMTSSTMLWPAPEAQEEAPEPEPFQPEPEAEPEPDPAMTSSTSLWPAPEATEEAPEPASAQPDPEPDEAMTPGTMLWPAPEAHEEAPEPEPAPPAPPEAQPEADPDEAMTSSTSLWPAPEAHEEAPEPEPVMSAPAAQPEPHPAPLLIAAKPSGEKLGPGPGAVAEAATDHWLVPAPGLPADWLIGASRYWETFRTPIVTDPGLIGALPPEKSLAVTLLATRAGAESAQADIAADWPNVSVDVISGDSLDDLRAELDRRARDRKEYG